MNSILLLISSCCNLTCPYCFAGEILASAKRFMSYKDYVKVLNYFNKDNNFHLVRLGGGEPTLNPDFIKIIRYAKKRHFDIDILTNGLFSNKILKELLSFDLRKLHFLININDPELMGKDNYKKLLKNIDSLSHYNVTIGINIYHHHNKYEYIVDLARKYGFIIRWSMAHPVGGKHLFVNPQEFRKIKLTIVDFLNICKKYGVSTLADCSTPLCLFEGNDRLVGLLNNIETHCTAPLMIDADLNVMRCFDKKSKLPLSKFRRADDIQKHYDTYYPIKKNNFWLKECRTCIHKDFGRCGGCCPHHVQTANNININNIKNIKNIKYHFNKGYKEYALKKGYYLKDIALKIDKDSYVVNKKMYELIKMLKATVGSDLFKVYQVLKKSYGKYSDSEFIEYIKILVKEGILYIWT